MDINKKNFIWNTIGITFNSFNSLFFLIIVNRIISSEQGGIFSYAFSLVCLFYIIALYYNRTYQISDINSEFSNNQYITNRYISSIVSIVFIIIFSIINNFNYYKTILIILLMLYKVEEAIADCFHGFIQKKEQLYYVGMSLFYKAIFSLILFFITICYTKNICISVFYIVLVNFIGLIYDIQKYKKLYDERIKLDFSNVFKLLKNAFSLFVFSFLIIFINNCQKYVAVYFVNNQLQNVLGIIIMPATMLTLCGQYLISPYLTKFAKLNKNKDMINFKKLLLKLLLVFVILGLIILCIAFLLGIPVLNIIYGINLNNYKLSFLLIIIASIFYAISTIISNCLTVLKRNNEQLIIYIISSLLSLLVSIVLISKFKVNGAAYAYLITMIIHFILSTILIKKYTKEKTRKR